MKKFSVPEVKEGENKEDYICKDSFLANEKPEHYAACAIKKQSKKGQWWCRPGVAVCVLCVVSVITAVTILIFMVLLLTRQQTAIANRETDAPLCLPCHTVPAALQAPGGQVTTRRARDQRGRDVQYCCGLDSKQFDTIVNEYVQTITEKNALKGKLQSYPDRARYIPRDNAGVVAHLVLEEKVQSKKDDDDLFPLTSWSHQSFYGAMLRRINYHQGRLVLNRTGNYYVYSQVHFLERPAHKFQPYRAQSLAHFLYKFSRYLPNGGFMQLLKNAKSRCSDEDRYLEHTSYLGAVLPLEAGDELFVKVSNLTAVFADPGSTYFGLYMVDSLVE